MRQNGFTLIVSLIFLVMMTMLGLAMFSGFTLDETMAGNLREKSRAFDAAQTAINSAEYWLAQPGNATIGSTCSTALTTPQVCSNALANPTTLPWVNAGISVTPASGAGSYAANPTYYIQYLGTQASGNAFYLITAAAQGGNANAVAVLQTVYKISVQSGDLGNG